MLISPSPPLPNDIVEVTGYYIRRQEPVGVTTFQCLTDIGEVWSFYYPAGIGEVSTKIGTIGFKNDVVNGWQSAAGDVNGDYLTDLVCVTPAGDLWLSKQLPFGGGYETPVRQCWGWSVSEANGAGILVGEVNGDGLDDVVQLTASGVSVALSNAGTIPYSTPAGDPGIQYRPQDGYWVGLGRVNSDSQADLVQVDPLGDVYVAWGLQDGSFANKQFRSHPNFVFNRATEFGITIGDINGDSRSDLVQITPLGEAWVALSINTGFSEPFKAGTLGFRFAPNVGDGWSIHVYGSQLLCLTQYGDVWSSGYSKGVLSGGSRVKFLNYKNGPPAPWLFFPGRR